MSEQEIGKCEAERVAAVNVDWPRSQLQAEKNALIIELASLSQGSITTRANAQRCEVIKLRMTELDELLGNVVDQVPTVIS